MNTDADFRRAVFASVVASLLVIVFIQPILTALSNLVLRTTQVLFTGWNDSLYESAALGHRNHEGVAVEALALTPLIAAGLFLSFLGLLPSTLPERIRRLVRTATGLRIIVGATMVLLSVGTIASIFIDLQLNTSFEQRLAALAPRLSDPEVKDFRAAWATMKTHRDYLAIQGRLVLLSIERHVVLPPPLIGAGP